jgi:hypothetical protein
MNNNKMDLILIIICVLFISCNVQIKGDHASYMKFRNNILRVLVSHRYHPLKRMIEIQNIKIKYMKNISSKKILRLYDKCLSYYYDTTITYNSLSEHDKTIIETILSLCY